VITRSFLSTHILPESREAICKKIIIIARGKVGRDGYGREI